MFAVIKSGGRQYKVSVGQTLEVNRLAVEDGEQVLFDEVLLISDADGAMVGTPFVASASVVATAVKQARGEKLIVAPHRVRVLKAQQRNKTSWHIKKVWVALVMDEIAIQRCLV